MSIEPTVPFATVLHANQLVIGDGYADRDGISATAVGYDAVLTLHLELGIPVALHMSGSVVEALAWHRPDLLARVRHGLRSGLVRIIGGTYGENIVPLATSSHNRRQLLAMADVMRDLLGVDPANVPTAWLPERVWRTGPVVSALADHTLPGGGYRRVLIDDRAMVPVCVDGVEYRKAFDASGPYAWPTTGWPPSGRGLVQPHVLCTRRIAGTSMEAVPLCSHLRYLVPPFDPAHLALVEDIARDLQPHGNAESPPLLVFGDDLERVAGVAGWEPALSRYETFLRVLSESSLLRAVHLDQWCDEHPATQEVDPDPATYYELAHQHGAGEDYQGWARDPRWAPYAAQLARVDSTVQAAVDARPDSPLVQLADRLALIGHHETAWQDRNPAGPGTAPAPWARATARHAADALPLLLADAWFHSPRSGLRALLQDIDDDGHDELVLAGSRLFAVLRPRWGARLTTLVRRGSDGQVNVLVGNPVDHWNFQEELGRFMDQPRVHPGALGVVGSEHSSFQVTRLEVVDSVIVAVLEEFVDTKAGLSCDAGRLRLAVTLEQDAEALGACWSRLGTPGELSVRNAICPDYHAALRGGRNGVRLEHRARVAGAWLDRISEEEGAGVAPTAPRAWVGVCDAPVAVLDPPSFGEAGHALEVNVHSAGRHLDLLIGGGSVDDAQLDGHLVALHSNIHGASCTPSARPEPVTDALASATAARGVTAETLVPTGNQP
jgi:glycosyl hydrolase family 57